VLTDSIRRAFRRWARLSENEKSPWHDLAEQEKQAHKEAFPGYTYCPRRSNSTTIIANQQNSVANANNNHHHTKSAAASIYSRFDLTEEIDMMEHSALKDRAKRLLFK
jgi:hypothetical protein